MIKSYQIIPLAFSDLPAVLEVYRQCEDFLALGPVATASEQMVLQDMEHAVREGSIFCGIYNDAGEMVGIVDYLARGFEGNPQHAFIELLMIGLPYRAQGVGTAVVDYVETEVRRNPDVIAILSGTAVNNPVAISFWQRRGYRIVGEPKVYPDNQKGFDLRKDLV
jgi:ribosomal protein S18 acetylase RimI-like enzyme